MLNLVVGGAVALYPRFERLVAGCYRVAESRRLLLDGAALVVEIEGHTACEEEEHHGDNDDNDDDSCCSA